MDIAHLSKGSCMSWWGDNLFPLGLWVGAQGQPVQQLLVPSPALRLPTVTCCPGLSFHAFTLKVSKFRVQACLSVL